MNRKLEPYYEYARKQLAMNIELEEILEEFKARGASLAIAIKTLEELGVDLDTIDKMLTRSIAWRHYFHSFEDLFFDFVELESDN